MSLYQDKVTDIMANADRYHQAYYEAETFHGPSLFFHHRALQMPHPPGTLKHLEYVYAALASWGMHRMGRGGSTMQNFDTFRRSIECLGMGSGMGIALLTRPLSPPAPMVIWC